MKQLIPALSLIILLLSGCAATAVKTAKQNANQVKNGMTVAQASAILGTPPNHSGSDFIEWRSNDREKYDGTPGGAIRFTLENGLTTGIPASGVISPDAAQKYYVALNAERYRIEEERAAALAKSKQEREEARERGAERARAAEAAKAATSAAALRDQLKEEAVAAKASSFTCVDKVNCAKAFSLAQIFVSNNADQKIQVATDTIIETYNPTETGNLGMKVIKTPGRGSNEMISIVPNCKEVAYAEYLCSLKRTIAYKGFRTFIETSLSR
jgi:hypothetical protein